MDSTTERSCLEEISVLVFDANEKVTLKTISNNWNVKNAVANEVMWTWLDKNEKKVKDLQKEFLVQGVNSKGKFCISVVPEEKKDDLESKWEKFSSLLYSIESRSNTRKLDLPDREPIKVKNILLKNAPKRDLNIPDITIVKEEPKVSKKVEAKPKTPFSSMKLAAKSEPKKTVIKQEASVDEVKQVAKSPEEKPASPSKEPLKETKTSKSSPEDEKTKSTATKKTQMKNQKPVQKGSISSFFNAKPGTSKPADKPKEKPVEKPIEVKEETPKKSQSSKTRKRSSTSPEVVAVEQKENEKKKKPAAKKIKLKEPNKKRSRIRVIEESSDEEEENKSELDEPESKFIKFDREVTPEPRKAPSVSDEQTPEKKSTPNKKSTPDNNKRKGKRWVTKRYTTDDGFIETERVLEEYSASEDENDENKKKNSPPKSKAAVAEKKSEMKSSPEKKKSTKPKPVAAAGKAKQANISSFFSKK